MQLSQKDKNKDNSEKIVKIQIGRAFVQLIKTGQLSFIKL